MPTIKFIGKITTMGKKKVVIYVPQQNHKEILKYFKGRHVRVTVEDAISD